MKGTEEVISLSGLNLGAEFREFPPGAPFCYADEMDEGR